MDFLRSDASIAILNSTNHHRHLAELDQVILAFYGALTSAMASILGSNPVRSESKAVPTQTLNWRKEDDKHLGQDRITRSEIVRLQLTKLKEASTPSCPLCSVESQVISPFNAIMQLFASCVIESVTDRWSVDRELHTSLSLLNSHRQITMSTPGQAIISYLFLARYRLWLQSRG